MPALRIALHGPQRRKAATAALPQRCVERARVHGRRPGGAGQLVSLQCAPVLLRGGAGPHGIGLWLALQGGDDGPGKQARCQTRRGGRGGFRRALLGFGGEKGDITGPRLRFVWWRALVRGRAPADVARRQPPPRQAVAAACAGRRMAGIEYGHDLCLPRGKRIDGAPQFAAADAAIELPPLVADLAVARQQARAPSLRCGCLARIDGQQHAVARPVQQQDIVLAQRLFQLCQARQDGRARGRLAGARIIGQPVDMFIGETLLPQRRAHGVHVGRGTAQPTAARHGGQGAHADQQRVAFAGQRRAAQQVTQQ